MSGRTSTVCVLRVCVLTGYEDEGRERVLRAAGTRHADGAVCVAGRRRGAAGDVADSTGISK
eukprot:6015250-Prymnesium_polylepis.1